MTDLTEQWKKGELPNGYYWIRVFWGGMVIMAYHTAFDGLFELDDHYYDEDEISEVLAKVPSYEEYQKLLSDQLAKNEGEEINAELEHRLAMVKANGKYPDKISRLKSRVVALSEEKAQLKELLRECKEWLEYLGIYKYTEDSEDCIKLLSELKEVLR